MVKDSNKLYEKRAKKFIISSFILIPIILYLGIRFLLQEDICNKKAFDKLGENFNKTIKLTDNEAKKLGIIEIIGSPGISLGFKEMLECERRFEYFLP